jgi:hypothetical protein
VTNRYGFVFYVRPARPRAFVTRMLPRFSTRVEPVRTTFMIVTFDAEFSTDFARILIFCFVEGFNPGAGLPGMTNSPFFVMVTMMTVVVVVAIVTTRIVPWRY